MGGCFWIEDFNFWYGDPSGKGRKIHALKHISFKIQEKHSVALIGPSGCGKSTFLRSLNRMNDLLDGTEVSGKILLDGQDIYAPEVNTASLRKKVGMVFQKPNPFPMSIYDNVAYGPRIHGIKARKLLDEIVEDSLKAAALWDEVSGSLKKPALGLSGGQQQRLCIARVLAVRPDVLLMDEPTSALDPLSTAKMEELFCKLKSEYTLVIVTHNLKQALRISDWTACFLKGELAEYAPTAELFHMPRDKRTKEFIKTT